MRLVKVSTSAGRSVNVVQLGDWDLLYAVPWTLVAWIWKCALRAAIAVMSVPAKPVHWAIGRFNLDGTWLIRGSPWIVAVVGTLRALGGAYSPLDFVGAIMVWAFLGVALAKLNVLKHGTWKGLTLSPKERDTQLRWLEQSYRLPEGFLFDPRSGRLVVLGAWGTVLWGSSLLAVVLTPGGWVRWAFIALLLAVGVLYDFEVEEHVASHSPGGYLIQSARKAPLLGVAQWVRRYLFFPANGWYRDYYFCVHTLHHHVENDGPADFQSMDRISRSSFFDFCRYVFLIGWNRLLCLETFSYFLQRRVRVGVRRLGLGMLMAIPVWLVMFWIEPLLAVFPVVHMLFLGIDEYWFAARWHALHHSAAPTRVDASSGDYAHYFHHKKPNVHIDDLNAIGRHFKSDKDEMGLFLFKPEVLEHYWYVQALMWSQDFGAISRWLVSRGAVLKAHKSLGDFYSAKQAQYPVLDEVQIRALVSDVGIPSSSRIQSLDRQASLWVGSWMQRMLKPAEP